ncbi:MAG: dTMP kinase [Candidatus Nanoarchaeia archaeon]
MQRYATNIHYTMKGKFIVICGTDGSGKGTQVKLLAERLQNEGHKVKVTDFPRYGEPSAKLVEEYLNGKYGSADEVGPKVASIFYACDRYAASFEMKKWLEEGCIVLSNRYTSANKGHQMGKIESTEEKNEFLQWLDDLEYGLFGIPKEDLNVLLYVPADVGQKLVDKKDARSYTEKKRDIHEANLDHLKKAAEAYKYVANKEGWTIIECAPNNQLMTIEQIHENLYNEVSNLIENLDTI